MKKILATLMVAAVGVGMAQAQGFIEFVGASAGITTNTSTMGGTASGLTFPGNLVGKVPFAYDYTLLYWTGTGSATTDVTSSGWSQVVTFTGSTPLLGTNFNGGGSISGNGGTAGVGTTLTPGQPYSVEFVGWSAGLGNSWSTVESELAAANADGGSWATQFAGNFFGDEGTIGTLTPTASTTGQPSMFPTTWANGSLTLYSVVTVPEPTTLALAGLGGLGMLFLRRRKS